MTRSNWNAPTPADIRAARKAAGLTAAKAAKLVHLSGVSRWSEYENGHRRIDRARWELFQLLTGQYEGAQLINGMLVIPIHNREVL